MSDYRQVLIFAEKNNFKLEQINGCRHFRPRVEKNVISSYGSEVFVGRIPGDCYEDELLPFFSTVGQVCEIRLMVSYQGKTRGFAFVKYYTVECAETAISVLNGQPIRNNRPLVVTKSTDHRTLVLIGVKPRANINIAQEVEEVFKSKNEELFKVIQVGPDERPMFLLYFGSHRAAAVTKRTFCVENKPAHWGHNAQLIWQPNNEVEIRIKNKKERESVRSNRNLQTSLLMSSDLTFDSASNQFPLQPSSDNKEWKENVPYLGSTVPMETERAGPSTPVNWERSLRENLPSLPVGASAVTALGCYQTFGHSSNTPMSDSQLYQHEHITGERSLRENLPPLPLGPSAVTALGFYQTFGHSSNTPMPNSQEFFLQDPITGYFVPTANQTSPNTRAIRGSGAMLKPPTNFRL